MYMFLFFHEKNVMGKEIDSCAEVADNPHMPYLTL